MKKKEETYRLTFKGFCTLQFANDEKTDHFLDALELWMRRADLNAILLDIKTGGFDAKKIYLEDK